MTLSDMVLLLVDMITVAGLLLTSGVACAPRPELGEDLARGWGQVVRLRHLYAARAGLHLELSVDGQVRGSADQSPDSLLEISPVSPGRVVLRGVATDRFLCMQRDATLYSSPTYSQDDCTFKEQILADGYSTYSSDKHGLLLSLGNHRQRQRGRDRGAPALAQFLPRISSLEVPAHHSAPLPDLTHTARAEEPMDNVDAFGKLSQIIHSPSFHER